MKRLVGFRFLWLLLKDSANGFVDNCALRLSAALSYYSVFSLAPLLILAIGLASLIFGDAAVRGQVSFQLQNYMGTSAAKAVESMIEGTKLRGDGWLATMVGCIMLLIGASGVFGQLKDALNTIWEVKTKPGRGLAAFMRDRLLSFGIVLVIGFLLLVSLLVTTLLASLTQYTRVHIEVPDAVWGGVNLGVSLLVSFALFAAIFKILPDVRIPWRTVGVGAVATAVLFELGKFALAFYLGRESTASTFGAAGSVVLVLLWVYYAAAILLFGAELTRAFARHTGTVVTLGRFAEPISAKEQQKEGLTPAA
jgi:membrane protein